jgi:hypothetical protein
MQQPDGNKTNPVYHEPEGDSLILPFGMIGVAGLVYSLSIRGEGRTQRWAILGRLALPWRHPVTSTRQAYLVLRAVSALFLLAGMRNA